MYPCSGFTAFPQRRSSGYFVSDYYHHKHVTVPQTFCVGLHVCLHLAPSTTSCRTPRRQYRSIVRATNNRITNLPRVSQTHFAFHVLVCKVQTKNILNKKGNWELQYMHSVAEEKRPYNGTLQTYGIQAYINLAKISHEIK